MTNDRDSIRFNALRNALYHSARRRSLERCNRWFNFIVVILGTAAFGDLLVMTPIDPRWLGAAVAAVGALQLVFDFGSQARDHQLLQRDYYQLLAEVEAVIDATPEMCADWTGRLTKISAEEPPIFRALDAKAYNDALDALETFSQSERIHIPLYQRLLGGVMSFDGYNYRKRAEISA